jgi:hypothetical protein
MSSVPQYVSVEEMATKLGIPHHLILFWQKKFNCFRMVIRPIEGQMISISDAALAGGIYTLLQNESCTLRDIQRLLKQKGISHVASFGRNMVVGIDQFNGTFPSDIDYEAQLSQLNSEEDDEDLDADLQTQDTLSRQHSIASYMDKGVSSGRPTLGATTTFSHRSIPMPTAPVSQGIQEEQPVENSLEEKSIPVDSVSSMEGEQRVSIFDIATGVHPHSSVSSPVLPSFNQKQEVETLVRERTHHLLSQVDGLNANAYNPLSDFQHMPAPHQMKQAIHGLMQTLQKLDTLHHELLDLETSLKDGLETMGFSGFRNAYKEYDERRFDLDVSVL